MYHFMFYFIYRRSLIKDGAFVARITARMVVTVVLTIHFALAYTILRFLLCYFENVSIARPNSEATSIDSLRQLLIIVAIFVGTSFYFNIKRIEYIMKLYDNIPKFYIAINILKFLSILIVPLLLAIFLVNKSTSYCQ